MLALIGGVFYGALVLALFGRRWLSLLRTRARTRQRRQSKRSKVPQSRPAAPIRSKRSKSEHS